MIEANIPFKENRFAAQWEGDFIPGVAYGAVITVLDNSSAEDICSHTMIVKEHKISLLAEGYTFFL